MSSFIYLKKPAGLRLAIIAVFASMFLLGCQRKPSTNIHNACGLFHEEFSWYRYHHKSKMKHGIPIWMQLAIVHVESEFDANAIPIKERKNGRIKTWSSAKGYSQALNGVWKEYSKEHPSWSRSRHSYKDSTDFIGWYLNRCHQKAGIAKNDTYNMYLCYHEGISGFKKRNHLKKKGIVKYAKKTELLARKYHKQLRDCETTLKLSHAYFM